jgi:hypothetical protein
MQAGRTAQSPAKKLNVAGDGIEPELGGFMQASSSKGAPPLYLPLLLRGR